MSYDPRSEFGIPGTFDPTESWPENEMTLHEGGADGIAPASDPITALAGGLGYGIIPGIPNEIEKKELPQWGPPFVAFVDGRISELERAMAKAIEVWSYRSRTDIFIASMNTDGSGNISPATNPNSTLYEPPPGFTFALHRISIVDAGHTLGSPYTAAGSYWELRINNQTVEGNSMISGQGQLPTFGTWGTRDALRVRDGEILSFFMSGGPTNTMITIKGQGTLDRTIEG